MTQVSCCAVLSRSHAAHGLAMRAWGRMGPLFVQMDHPRLRQLTRLYGKSCGCSCLMPQLYLKRACLPVGLRGFYDRSSVEIARRIFFCADSSRHRSKGSVLQAIPGRLLPNLVHRHRGHPRQRVSNGMSGSKQVIFKRESKLTYVRKPDRR